MRVHERQLAAGERGATILEFLIYIAIVGFTLTTATAFAFEFVTTQARVAAHTEINRNGRYAVARMAVEVRESTGVNAGSSTFGANPSTLSMSTAAPSTDPTVLSVSAGTLNIQQGATTLPLTSSKVEVTEFVVDDVSTAGKTREVRIRLRLKYKNTSGWELLNAENTFETTARIHKRDGFSN